MSRATILFAALALWQSSAAGAVTITILSGDGASEGFNDPTPVTKVTGNNGTTLGDQRRNVFLAAAAYWSNRLTSAVPISVAAQIDPLTCSPSSGTLGAAGATNYFANFANAPLQDTWYPAALANAFRGADLSSAPEIVAMFNSRLDSDASCLTGIDWYYGVGGSAPTGTISFYDVIVHELAHGLGFLTIVDPNTGARAQGLDDDFMLLLEDHSTGKTWPQMNNAERAASARDAGDLHWIGASVQAAGIVLSSGRHPSGHVRMYAPATLNLGSSVSHWDTALVPDEIMEPFSTPHPADLLTTQLLHDIGWELATTGLCVPDASTGCLQGGRFEVKVDWQTAAANGAAQVMTFGGQRAENNDSVFWWFFAGTNFEMGIKVLNACAVNQRFWVYVSGLTDQGWSVHLRDTQSGIEKTYANAVGHLSTTFADTQAFSCP